MLKSTKLKPYLLLPVFLGTAFSAVSADKLTVVSWGGSFTKSQVEAYHKPFIEETGVQIVSEDFNGGLAEIKAQVESGNVTWDLVSLDKPDIVRGCAEGLLETFDPSLLPAGADGTPAKDDFIEGAVHKCAVNSIVVSTILAINESQFEGKAKPSKMTDLFDIKTFPGRRGLQKIPQGNMEWALLADGVAPEEVYELLETREGRDRAFSKLNSIKEHVFWWTTGAQAPQMLADGEVVISSAFNGRISNAKRDENQPFKIIWDRQMGYMNGWAIPKGSKNLERAVEFVVHSSKTKPLADQAKYISYGPTRKSSTINMDKDLLNTLPTAPQNFETAFLVNDEWWGDYADELNEEFNTWLAK